MTETVDIRQDVTNPDYHSTRQFSQSPLPSTPRTLPYKRRVLDRWTDRVKASGLPGNGIVADYLHEKYIKNLSFHTIDHSGGTFWINVFRNNFSSSHLHIG